MRLSLCCQGFGVERSQLSLDDRLCHPTENRTHYVWTFGLTDCGTMMTRHRAVISYENAVSQLTQCTNTPAHSRILCLFTFKGELNPENKMA